MDTLALVLFHCFYPLDFQTSDDLSSGEASILGYCLSFFQLLLVTEREREAFIPQKLSIWQLIECSSQKRPSECQNYSMEKKK